MTNSTINHDLCIITTRRLMIKGYIFMNKGIHRELINERDFLIIVLDEEPYAS
jgi:hypothetical protein